MAGNDTEGLRYATIGTPEKYYLRWVEDAGPYASGPNLLDRHLLQVCSKPRLLELIHDFVVFDAGIKKLCRQNQYFGVKSAQDFVRLREGGIIWHTQGSGKSLTMVWLAKWIAAHDVDCLSDVAAIFWQDEEIDPHRGFEDPKRWATETREDTAGFCGLQENQARRLLQRARTSLLQGEREGSAGPGHPRTIIATSQMR